MNPNILAKKTSAEYRRRHAELKSYFLEGYSEQKNKNGTKSEVLQNTKWYSIFGWLRTTFNDDTYDPRIDMYTKVIGKIYADDLTLTQRSITNIDTVALYEYYNTLQESFSPAYFKDYVLADYISIRSTICVPTSYSWFYKFGMRLGEEEKYPSWVFAKIIYIALANPRVVLEESKLDELFKVSEFYRMLKTEPQNSQM